ncbi:methionyl-tRNA formyltransferase [[Mycoplasma] testudinis]|uniref:methionyl-tRNA formyltransferase n=1 Tax=[Mycoplasma] testudinis TaxID=33924 RepID=UPI000485416A|nr:methionyl-tRNA formyltransferase [[Mycoplasma] testudinis]
MILNKTRIVFFGSTSLSVACLIRLYNSNEFEIVAIVTQPDKPVGRNQKIIINPVKQFAIDNNILCFQPIKLNQEIDQIIALGCPLGVCVAYGQRLSLNLLNSFKYGVINVHPSLLPQYRGAAPINYAIWNQDSQTAISIMKMEQTMDTGPICCQNIIDIPSGFTSGDLLNVVIQKAPGLLYQSLLDIISEKVIWIQQDKTNPYLVASMLTKQQEKIDWSQPAIKIVGHINAFSPIPGTYTNFADQKIIKFYHAEAVHHNSNQLPPGTVLKLEPNVFLIACGESDKAVRITEFLLPGKKRTKVINYHGTYPFKIGDVFF